MFSIKAAFKLSELQKICPGEIFSFGKFLNKNRNIFVCKNKFLTVGNILHLCNSLRCDFCDHNICEHIFK